MGAQNDNLLILGDPAAGISWDTVRIPEADASDAGSGQQGHLAGVPDGD